MLPALLLALFAARPATAQTPLTTPADAPVGVTAGDAASTSETPSSAAASANRAAPAPLNTIAVGHRELPSIPPTRQAARQIAEVIVTAQKNRQRIQDVPISVTAGTGDLHRGVGPKPIPEANGKAHVGT